MTLIMRDVIVIANRLKSILSFFKKEKSFYEIPPENQMLMGLRFLELTNVSEQR